MTRVVALVCVMVLASGWEPGEPYTPPTVPDSIPPIVRVIDAGWVQPACKEKGVTMTYRSTRGELPDIEGYWRQGVWTFTDAEGNSTIVVRYEVTRIYRCPTRVQQD